jgi:hypothetical protein
MPCRLDDKNCPAALMTVFFSPAAVHGTHGPVIKPKRREAQTMCAMEKNSPSSIYSLKRFLRLSSFNSFLGLRELEFCF